MITVDKMLDSEKKSSKAMNAVNEELLTTGKVKAKTQSYLPYFILAGAAIIGAIWLWKKGKQDNGAVSD